MGRARCGPPSPRHRARAGSGTTPLAAAARQAEELDKLALADGQLERELGREVAEDEGGLP